MSGLISASRSLPPLDFTRVLTPINMLSAAEDRKSTLRNESSTRGLVSASTALPISSPICWITRASLIRFSANPI